MIIAVEGLPGAGKTTTARLLAQLLEAPAILETTADHPFLNQVYDASHRDDLTVELAFLLVHANPYRRLDRSCLTVCDFSPAKDELFAEDMLGGNDLELFTSVYRRAYRGHPMPEVAVYLRIDPEHAMQRVAKRMQRDSNRAFEAGLTLDRLRRMEARYEAGLDRLGQRLLVCDVRPDVGPQAVADEVAEILSAADVLD